MRHVLQGLGLSVIMFAIVVVIATLARRTVPEIVDMNVSAYCKGSCCCGSFADGITASGKPAEGKLIAAPTSYPFGTEMDVPGYGRAVVEDRGGAIKGNKIDLLFPSHQEALEWGRQYLKVEVYR